MNSLKIKNKLIGKGRPVFIIAEAGVNHNGKLSEAKRLVDIAKESGADAVKFQIFKTEDLVIKNAPKARYQLRGASRKEKQFGLLKRLELSDSDFRALINYARRKKIIFLASPFDKKSVDFLCKEKVPAIKIASGEATNLPLLKYIGSKRRPVILSTGMCNTLEITGALRALRTGGARKIILMHCVSSYPAAVSDANLRVMGVLRERFKLAVGFSDHTLGIAADLAAVALGACVIEKHFTADRSKRGPDHRASLEPFELKQMVKGIREVESAMGSPLKICLPCEEEIKRVARKSIVAGRDIPKGVRLSFAKLAFMRPGTGLSPKLLDKVLGKAARRDIKKGALLSLKDLK